MPRKTELDFDVLSAALEGLTNQRGRIEDQIAAVKRMLGKSTGPAGDSAQAPPQRRSLSAAARKRIAGAQRQRWDAYHKSQAAPRKRRLSAAGKKRIADAARKRWAAFRRERAKKAGKKEPAGEAAAS